MVFIYIFTYTMSVNCSILHFAGVEIAELGEVAWLALGQTI